MIKLQSIQSEIKDLQEKNYQLKNCGLDTYNPHAVFKENESLKDLIKYCLQLRKLEIKNGSMVDKETRNRIESRVEELIVQ
jgi:hypothetical protein